MKQTNIREEYERLGEQRHSPFWIKGSRPGSMGTYWQNMDGLLFTALCANRPTDWAIMSTQFAILDDSEGVG